ncbi:hypothetical protein NPIL_8181 [Nephila pilipes]|uniref:Uncharacterized protein n=1 Tax=Nephila pilipes TaxID=299642 RepID=A0A8X6NAQ1_NEPPI|nr:hypothetical protein NPIL_8181 [Nephila pilipes]
MPNARGKIQYVQINILRGDVKLPRLQLTLKHFLCTLKSNTKSTFSNGKDDLKASHLQKNRDMIFSVSYLNFKGPKEISAMESLGVVCPRIWKYPGYESLQVEHGRQATMEIPMQVPAGCH